jgi:hypothetical protein
LEVEMNSFIVYVSLVVLGIIVLKGRTMDTSAAFVMIALAVWATRSMVARNVSAEERNPIAPNMVGLNPGPAIFALSGTLGNAEMETCAAWFVAKSQETGRWTTLEVEAQVYGDMVSKGFLSEIRTRNGKWAYALTDRAIEQIYSAQQNHAIHMKLIAA